MSICQPQKGQVFRHQNQNSHHLSQLLSEKTNHQLIYALLFQTKSDKSILAVVVSTHLKNMLVKLEIIPKVRGENPNNI